MAPGGIIYFAVGTPKGYLGALFIAVGTPMGYLGALYILQWAVMDPQVAPRGGYGAIDTPE